MTFNYLAPNEARNLMSQQLPCTCLLVMCGRIVLPMPVIKLFAIIQNLEYLYGT